MYPSITVPAAFAVPSDHVSREQRLRCDRVEVVHFLSHANDDVLCQALDSGAYPWANLTSADVRLNRRLRGPCICCLEGKFRSPSMPSSDTPPATAVGDKISVDTQELRVKSAGGNLCYIDSCDEFSGDLQVTPCKSLKAVDIFSALLALFHRRYTSYGHKVVHVISDSLPAMEPVVAMLGALGMLLTFTPPGQHAQRVERCVGSLAGRRRAVYASIPFYIPDVYSLYGRIWVADSSNALPNEHSRPSCPDVLVTGRRRVSSELRFGQTCMVAVPADKRRREASALELLLKDVHRSELGVCLGYSRSTPGAYEFLLSDKQVVVRDVLQPVNIVPFGWAPKKVLLPFLFPPSAVPSGLPTSSPPEVPSSDPLPSVPTALLPVAPDDVPSVVPSPIPPSVILPPAPVGPPVAPPLPSVLPSVLPLPSTAPPILPPVLADAVLLGPCPLPVPAVLADAVSGSLSSRGRPRRPRVPVSLSVPAPVHSILLDSLHVHPAVVDVVAVVDIPVPHSIVVRDHPAVTSLPDPSPLDVPAPVGVSPPSLDFVDRRLAHFPPPPSYMSSASYAYLADSFDTRMEDEFLFDEMLLRSSSLSFAVSSSSPLPSSSRIPVPSTRCKEVPLSKALRSISLTRLTEATTLELAKQQGFKAVSTHSFLESQLPPHAIVVDAHVLYKDKADGRYTCRIAAMGDRLPPQPTQSTFASVVSDGAKYMSVALMQAYCHSTRDSLLISDADVVGGFLHIPLNSPVPMFLRLPKNLPHPHALYGLRESNRLFSLEMSRVLVRDAGFTAGLAEPQQYTRSDPAHPSRKCIVSVTVDDLLILTNHASLRDSLLKALTARFGSLTVNLRTSVHTGVEFTQLSNGAVLITQDLAIARAASVEGVSHYPRVAVPAASDFFLPFFSGAEAVPVDPESYASLTGKLVQFLKTRHDVRLLVSYLCGFNHEPLEGHYRRALHVLAYLASTPSYGCTFYSDDLTLVFFSDSAYGVFRDGYSSSAALYSIGRYNAPFFASARAQTSVATCPMTAEYYSASHACQAIVHFSQVATDLGWPPSAPIPLYVDNRTMISLVEAPQVSVKSRHIEQQYHYIRQLNADRFISLIHVPAAEMRANVMTKVLPRARFLKERDDLFQRCRY